MTWLMWTVQGWRRLRRLWVERDRGRRDEQGSIKVDDLACARSTTASRNRVRAHVLIAMLVAYLVWHARRA